MSLPWMARSAALLPLPALAVEADSARSLQPLTGGGVMQMLLGLTVVLVLIIGTAWLLRRYAPLRAGAGTIKVVGAVALSTRERMVLVQVDEVRLLVGIAPGRIQTLHVFAASAKPIDQDFAATLSTVQKGSPHE
jgi:flagellar protein FliO/FliZ